jgi:hypothetical protein
MKVLRWSDPGAARQGPLDKQDKTKLEYDELMKNAEAVIKNMIDA